GGNDDVAVDLRVDDHADPITELSRLLDLNDLYLTASTDEEKVPVDDTLHEELDDRARRLGFRDFHEWVGTENYEMRVSVEGDEDRWVDRQILAILREQS
ncbi:MAG TPA: putative peptidoglycan binding domain-containing protein, partial [Microlunatus sp.]|nr:putative peptidoglycan binding domain-containing protein [Microlunatus sp.]